MTEHPPARWTAQQIVEAFPFDTTPSHLIRDGDGIYGERVRRMIESLGIDEVVTAPASPWQCRHIWITTIRGEHTSLWIAMRQTVVPYEQRNRATSLNFQPSTAFTMSILQRPHQYSGPTGFLYVAAVFAAFLIYSIATGIPSQTVSGYISEWIRSIRHTKSGYWWTISQTFA